MSEKLGYNPETDEQKNWQLIQESAKEILVSKKEQLTDWRRLDERGRQARQLRKIVEVISGAKKAIAEHPEMAENIQKQVMRYLKLTEILINDERARQFQARFVQETLGLSKNPVRPEVEKFSETLKKAPSSEGEINCFDLLAAPGVDLTLKRAWLESQILPRLNFLVRRDLIDAQKPPPESELPGNLPPADKEEMQPSIDETEKQQGEPQGFFTATPFYGGYWKEKTFEQWNSDNLTFTRSAKQRAEMRNVEVNPDSRRVLQGRISPGRTSLPLPYNFSYLPETIKLAGGQVNISEDQDGNCILENPSNTPTSFAVSLARRSVERATNPPAESKEISTGQLSQETEKYLTDLRNDSSLLLLDKARELKQYVRRLLEYPGEGDSKYNQIYYQNPSEFFRKIEQHKKADCDVANTFYIALLSRLGIAARLAVGHYIKIKDNHGRAVFSSGTGHAWTEIWDNGWHRLDATPAGDPSLDDEEMDEKQDDEDFEGDFGETEAEVISDEELAELIEEAKKLKQETEKQKLPPAEQAALYFAQEAGCSPNEAKRILAELASAKELKDSRGRRILDLLSAEFGKIIRQNFREVPSYRAPVRISEGDELENPVEAWIDIKAGETDPTGFRKFEKKIEKLQEYGGFDCIGMADKSASMGESDPQTGQIKSEEQRRLLLLIFDALHRFVLLSRQNQIRMLNKIDVRTGLITFQAGGAKLVLPLSENWGPKEQLTIWRALGENIGGGTPDHLGLAAARQLIQEDTAQSKIKENVNVVEAVGLTNAAKEVEATYYPSGKCLENVSEAPEWAAQRIIANIQRLYPQKVEGPQGRSAEKKRLRLIIVTADGGSDNKAAVQQELANLISK